MNFPQFPPSPYWYGEMFSEQLDDNSAYQLLSPGPDSAQI